MELLVAVLLLGSAWGAPLDYVTVTTTHGDIRGQEVQTIYQETFFRFMGVPYAKPPIGDLRFQAPQDPDPWTGVRDALADASYCVQTGTTSDFANEDCLYLNVYTPELPGNGSQLRSVIVWIHGGGFVNGAGSNGFYGPDFLVREGVVVVSPNYRLNIFGFLNLEDNTISANNGLKDQVAALRWVRDNIAAFGGNPDDVTIFGESAGGASIHYHLLSPLSAGLFHRAISNSGSALNAWAFTESPRERAFRLGSALGLNTSDPQELVDFLRAQDSWNLLANMQAAYLPEDINRVFKFVLVPSVEPEGEGAFLTEAPASLLSKGLYNDVDYLTGVTSRECIFMLDFTDVYGNPTQQQFMDENFVNILSPDLRVPKEQQAGVAAQVKTFYFGDSPISDPVLNEYIDMFTDLYFFEGVASTIRIMAANSNKARYMYEFGYTKTEYRPGYTGVSHGGDVPFLFLTGQQDLDPASEESLVRFRMARMWTNFAKYGNPTPQPEAILNNLEWPEYSSANREYLDINVDLLVKNNLHGERADFWASILPP